MTRPAETEQTFLIGQQWDGFYRDRYSYERDTLLLEAVRAWRLNPLARRLANLYKIYNLDGIEFKCDHEPTQKFLTEFWNHDLNQMDEMLEEISNEIFLTGNLFPMFSVDKSGMTYVRIFPTDQIGEIKTADNDLRQEIAYVTREIDTDVQSQTFLNPRGLPSITTPKFMHHYAINKLAGTSWGEGEIWPDLPWLGRYATWLEDRVRLNHFRAVFMYVLQGTFKDKTEKEKRQQYLNSNPPRSGTVLVTDASEQWGTLSANLDAFDASVDGMAIKKMIAVNHAPMHYLAEPESSTRTTADAAGTPTFKAFENNQRIFKKILKNILTVAVQRRAEKDGSIDTKAEINILASDATERDNAGLALATSQIVSAIGDMYDRKLLDEDEYLRLTYRFMGETPPQNKEKVKGIRKNVNKPASANQGGLKVDAETGAVKEKVPGA
jgi:hypothetical protein